MEGGESQMVKYSAKVFGYVDRSLKERVARLKDYAWRWAWSQSAMS